jgi:hypothetical protein
MAPRPILNSLKVPKLQSVEAEAFYEPKIGLEPMEVMTRSGNSNLVHPGHAIFDLRDTRNMMPDEIRSLVDSIDQRALQNAPKEILDAIQSQDITDIFRTSSGEFDAAGNEIGSIYFRRKDGATARWKLPELAEKSALKNQAMGQPLVILDAGWDANKGSGIFSTNTAYFDPSSGTKAADFKVVDAVIEQVNKGTFDQTLLPDDFYSTDYNYSDAILKGRKKIPLVIPGQSASTSSGPAQAAPAPAPGPSPATTPAPGPSPAPGPATASPPPPGPVGRPVNTATINATGAPRTVVSGGAPGASVVPPQAPTPPPPSGSPGAVITQRPPTPSGSGVPTRRPSTGAPGGRGTRSMGQVAADVANWVTSGTKGAKALKAAGAGMILGIGAGAISRRDISVDEEEIMRLEMQRRGM